MAKPKALQKKKDISTPFIEALKFISLAQRDKGEVYQTHLVLSNRTAVAFDGAVAAGIYVDQDIEACPHTELLISALGRAEGVLSIIQQQGNLVIKTDKLTAHVPCVDPSIMQRIAPDPPLAPINNVFIQGLEKISGVATENGSRIINSTVLIRQNSMVATDGHIMFEYWHAIDLPTFALPKAAANALMKCGKELAAFGYSGRSATFYFTDNSWIKTQIADGTWPTVDQILNIASRPWPVPPGFFDGVRQVAPFNDKGWIMFRRDELASQREENGGAAYKVQGVPPGQCFNAKYLLMLEPLVNMIDFVAEQGKAAFFGENLRGILLGVMDRSEQP